MRLTIDRISDGIAVLIGREDESVRMTIPVFLLPAGSQEGDILVLVFTLDRDATDAAKERTVSLIEKLKNRT